MTIPSEALKRCTKCGTEKPLTSYYVRRNGHAQSFCKPCVIAKNRERRNGPERAKVLAIDSESSRRVKARRRERVFKAYGGYRCVCCGETEPKFLSLDHINNDGAEFRKREFGTRLAAGWQTYKWLEENGYPPGVQVMCMNCQHGKRMNGGTCPHRQRTCNDYPDREYGQAAGSAAPLHAG